MVNLNYSQSSGLVTDSEGTIVAHGWAGNHEGKNNPDMQDKHNIGPLPRGLYRVGPWHTHGTIPGESGRLGPMVAHLEQIEGETFGRSAFFIHGPSSNPVRHGEESQGCIVIPYVERKAVRDLNPDTVTVTV